MAKVVKVGHFGGNGGCVFDSGAFCRLVDIKIRHGRAIDAITVTYLVNGRIESHQLGGEGGGEVQIVFKPGEFLTGTSGFYGPLAGDSDVVRSLTFISNLDQYGPYGKTEGTSLAVPVLNGKIVGFFGRSADLLNAIGVDIVPCGPEN